MYEIGGKKWTNHLVVIQKVYRFINQLTWVDIWVIYINGGGCKMQAYKQQVSNGLSRY